MKKILLFLSFSIFFFSCKSEILESPTLTVLSQSELGFISVSWSRNYKADGYTVFRSTSKDGEYVAVSEVVKATSWIDRDESILTGSTFWYKLVALRFDTIGAEISRSALSVPLSGIAVATDSSIGSATSISSECSGVTNPIDPADESLPLLFQGIKISWDSNVSADYYRIQKENEDGLFLFMNNLNSENPSPLLISGIEFTDFYPNYGAINRYRVVPFAFATDSSADLAGVPSVIVSVNLPLIPTGISWSTKADDSLDISWDSVLTATEYCLFRQYYDESSESDVIEHFTTAEITYNDSSLPDINHKYSYNLIYKSPVSLSVGDVEGDSIEFYFDHDSSITAYFFKATTLEISQGDYDYIELTWENAKESSILEYSVYRQKVVYSCTKGAVSDGVIPTNFSETTIHPSKAQLESQKVDAIASTSFIDVNALLYLGTVSALDGDSNRVKDVIYKDETTDISAPHPGLYRYYIVGGDSFITATGYRTATDREFLQIANRYLDFAITNRDSGTNLSSNLGGGTFSCSISDKNAMSRSHWDYYFSNFNMGELTFSSSLIQDDYFKYNIGIWRYGRRKGTLTVSGIYSGSIEFQLARDWGSRRDLGGSKKSKWYNSFDARDTSDNPPDSDINQGYYRLSRNGNEHDYYWDEGQTPQIYQNESSFNSLSDTQEGKTEPNFTSDYYIWE